MVGVLLRCMRQRLLQQSHHCQRPVRHFAQLPKKCDTKQINNTISLAIMDKDGTLQEFGTGWSDWLRQFSKSLEDAAGIVIGDKLFHLFGYDLQSQKWREGLMCDNPENINVKLVKFLEEEGMKQKANTQAVEQCLTKIAQQHFMNHDVVPIDDPLAICKTLRHFNIKTALCTMDSKDGTEHMITKLGLENAFDYILCGDDDHAKAKPDPTNIYHICEVLNVAPTQAVFIGDAQRDVEMGKQAKVGLNIGVLSGVCNKDELSAYADVVVTDVAAALEYFLPNGYQSIFKEKKDGKP